VFNSAPKYLWFAVPSQKTQWQDLAVSFNHGNVGSVDDLFGPPTIITVNGVQLYLYVTMYATQVANILQIS
jgi:hypothetical protein